MNKIIIALGIALVSATSAFAQSSALDVIDQKTEFNAAAVDYVATGSVGSVAADEFRYGDTSPMNTQVDGSVDRTATGSIGGASQDFARHLGGNA